jgi:hypothetical protein
MFLRDIDQVSNMYRLCTHKKKKNMIFLFQTYLVSFISVVKYKYRFDLRVCFAFRNIVLSLERSF